MLNPKKRKGSVDCLQTKNDLKLQATLNIKELVNEITKMIDVLSSSHEVINNESKSTKIQRDSALQDIFCY